MSDDQLRLGDIKSVSAAAITPRENAGVSLVSRAEIWRVTVRDPAGSSRWPRVLQTAAIGAAVTALRAHIATANYENGSHAGPVQVVLLGTGIGAAVGAIRAPQQDFHERLVLIRPGSPGNTSRGTNWREECEEFAFDAAE